MKTNFSLLIFFTFIFVGFCQENNSTASSNVSIIEKQFLIPELNTINHKIWVYLPPNYKTSTKKYPVIYMHDAQNLFDAKTSYAGEWKVDETLNEIYKKTNKGFIVVGVENGGEERINEYTPWEHKKYGGGKGEIYINFIVNTLKPYIDATYRTKPQQKYTGLIGSSLGGLISYYGGLKYPTVFGKIGALSTSFWFSDEVIMFTKKHGKIKNQKLYLLVGGKEGESMDTDTQKMEKLLLETGFKKRNLKSKINPEGKHNEAFWSSEFKEVISWLYNIK
ncbi:alpha/beta hydrolase [Lutibacter maritimus]|uniref:Predicted hydrolase of the alpha/beta superfamily n=1 Tax=Lutibacter maritimus TaxID=593133 RepID=A0A1I6PL02_9FLAO|nr:alpha/beta hydrolase-fold protein [Lutibacter maritimus]SFS40725.1 Predicted hydrolase of the alpha/beta superfamily [Lutibacter maritimus]